MATPRTNRDDDILRPSAPLGGTTNPYTGEPETTFGAERGGFERSTEGEESPGGMKERLKGKARDLAESGREKLRSGMEAGKDRALGMAESQKERVADRIDSAGQRIEDRMRPLEEQGGMKARAGRVGHRVGDALEGSAEYLRTHPIPTMRDDIETRVRSHPFMSVGLAAGAGFLLGRLTSGGDEEEHEQEEWRQGREQDSKRQRFMSQLRGPIGRAFLAGASARLAQEVRNRL